jgi:hypothetical protein
VTCYSTITGVHITPQPLLVTYMLVASSSSRLAVPWGWRCNKNPYNKRSLLKWGVVNYSVEYLFTERCKSGAGLRQKCAERTCVVEGDLLEVPTKRRALPEGP